MLRLTVHKLATPRDLHTALKVVLHLSCNVFGLAVGDLRG